MTETIDTAIVGAGMAGLTAAGALLGLWGDGVPPNGAARAGGGGQAPHTGGADTPAGAATGRRPRILLIDKGRQVGGRMANRRFRGMRYDTGAQFFTAPCRSFDELAQAAQEAGAATRWYERPATGRHTRPLTVWRGENAMSDVPKWMAARLALREPSVALRTATRVAAISARNDRIGLSFDDGAESVSARNLLLTTPIPQALALLSDELRALVPPALETLAYHPCLVLLAAVPRASAAFLDSFGRLATPRAPIDSIVDNRLKGLAPDPASQAADGGGDTAHLTIHFSAGPSAELYERADEEITGELVGLLREFDAGLHHAVVSAAGRGAVQLKKWKYARPRTVHPERAVALTTPGGARLLFAGDIFAGPRVEGAFLSGLAAAGLLRGEGAP